MSEVARKPDTRTPIERLRARYRLTFLIGIGFFVLAVIGFGNDSLALFGNSMAFSFGVFASWAAGLLFLVGGAGWMVASLLIADRNS